MTCTKVYVGNLPPDCNEKSLRTYFEKYGKIIECDIVVNKFAFVHFADSEEAKLAVDILNNKEWDGVKLKVELSTTKLRPKPGMGQVCYRCGTPGHMPRVCPDRPNRGRYFLKYSNASNNSENRGPPSHENRSPYSDDERSRGNSGVFFQNEPPYNPNGYRHDSFRDSYHEPSSSSYYERNNSNAYSGFTGQSSRENRDLYMKSESSHGNNGGFSQSDPLGGYNGYRNDTFRDSYWESSSSSTSSYYKNRDISQNNNPYYDNYSTPPQPHTRYRPYPSASERRGPLPPVSGTSKPFIQSSLFSTSSVTDYHHQNTKNHPSSSSIRKFDPYARPPPEYYDRQRDDWEK